MGMRVMADILKKNDIDFDLNLVSGKFTSTLFLPFVNISIDFSEYENPETILADMVHAYNEAKNMTFHELLECGEQFDVQYSIDFVNGKYEGTWHQNVMPDIEIGPCDTLSELMLGMVNYWRG